MIYLLSETHYLSKDISCYWPATHELTVRGDRRVYGLLPPRPSHFTRGQSHVRASEGRGGEGQVVLSAGCFPGPYAAADPHEWAGRPEMTCLRASSLRYPPPPSRPPLSLSGASGSSRLFCWRRHGPRPSCPRAVVPSAPVFSPL